jgi:SAM-dependent methyltransferase
MAQKTCYAASKNKEVILDVLRPVVGQLKEASGSRPIRVLEIASGTGEHANLFASSMDNLQYQPTEPDLTMHESIVAWTESISHSTVNRPIALDVSDLSSEDLLPVDFRNNQVDLMICINMIHISPFRCTEALFRLASTCLRPGGSIVTYGPYRVCGSMTESNVAFDLSLRARNAEWGVRDLEDVVAVAEKCGIVLKNTVSMPANNLSLVFTKVN